MERNLSSRMTPFAKFVLPVVGSGVMGWITLFMFRSPKEVVYPSLEAFLRWLAVGWWLFATLYFGQRAVRLRRVRIDDSGVVVSNYRREIHVPFAAIADVTYKLYYYRDVYVTLTFRQITPLGRRALILLPSGAHYLAIVNELRRHAGLSASSQKRAPAV